jgi:3-hydroxyisobutyrate dehydrogenase-like beta-hydroxyacid dehydrogenase
MHIAFVGFGEAARAFVQSLAQTGIQAKQGLKFTAFDILDSPAMAQAMADHGVARADDPAGAIAGADWIISAVTADQSLIAAQSAAAHIEQGQVWIDINSVSPDRKKDTAAVIEAQHGTYLDMAVMAPVHPRGHSTPVLIAGTSALDMGRMLGDLGFDLDVVSETPGEATAVKMGRALFVKGLEAITVECALAAAASGVYDRVIPTLERSYPGLGWPDILNYNFERTLRHGTRRAAEMRESGATLDALGLTGGLAREIAAVQDKMGALPETALPKDAPELITAIAKIATSRGACGRR